MKKYIIFLSFFFIFKTNMFPQYNFNNKKEIALYNIISSALIGGIGALINNNNNQKGIDRFTKGLYKGAISGGVIFMGKDLISKYPENKNYGYIWASNIIVSTGSSMLENTIENRKLIEKLHYNLGFFRFDIYPYMKMKTKIRIMPYSLSNTIWLFSKYKFNLENTLKTGNFVFYSDLRKSNNKIILGTVYSNNLLITDVKNKYDKEVVISHEMLHIYQINTISSINVFYIKLEKSIFKNTKFYTFYKKIFYSDYENFSHKILYISSNYFFNYEKNIFESEAFFLMDK